MTEAEWPNKSLWDKVRSLEMDSPRPDNLPFVSDRKLRFFACECCRRIRDLLDDPGQAALEVVERFVEGRATSNELLAMGKAAYREIDRLPGIYAKSYDQLMSLVLPTRWAVNFDPVTWKRHKYQDLPESLHDLPEEEERERAALVVAWPIWAIYSATLPVWGKTRRYGRDWSASCVWEFAALARVGAPPDDCTAWCRALDAEHAFQNALLDDILGNLFRPGPKLDPAWLRWNDTTIPKLAQQMYDSREFTSMPILADALEEAGCTNADILEHCRGPGPHVRRCWVVDLVLGKE